MTQEELYLLSLVIGQILPPAIDLINKWVTSAKLRFIVSMGISAIIGVLFNFNNIHIGSLAEVLTTILIVFGSAQGAYNLYYKGSKVQNIIRHDSRVIPLP